MYLHKQFNKQRTPQSRPIHGAGQVANSAGGFAWAVDDWVRLDRFLILGAEGGTFYVGEQRLTLENAEAVSRCLALDGQRVVARVVEISQSGRAPKNDPALFVLALAAGLGNPATRQAALAALPKVARTGTHLFHFLAYVENFRGWGRGLRRAVVHWYNDMPLDRLAYQAIKYQQRDGWSHRDALRLAHPKADAEGRNALYRWITHGWPVVDEAPQRDEVLRLVWAFERARLAQDEQTIIGLITDFGLPWEAVPTQWLGHAAVWRALLPQLPLTALLRNLARMTANGLLTARSQAVAEVIERLENRQQIRQARIHPIAVLAAMQTYAQGHGMRGQLKWQPLDEIVAALDRAFYLAFGNVTPTGKRIVLALDVSGSMEGGMVGGVVGLTPRVASAAMALITAATEPLHQFVAFAHQMQPLDIRPGQRLDEVVRTVRKIPFGGTDCALPMIWAQQGKVQADAFVVYTDSETWAGKIHPVQALREYRRNMGIAAKLVVVGMVANRFTIADPNDAGMLDVVGFDTAAPQVIGDFIATGIATP